MAIKQWTGLRRFARDDEGVTTLEVVIVFPAFFAAFFFIAYACMYHYSTQVTLAAAEEGARVAAVTNDPSQGYTAAKNYAGYVGGGWITGVTVGPPARPPIIPGQIQIVVTGKVTPIIFGFTLSLSQTAISTPETFSSG